MQGDIVQEELKTTLVEMLVRVVVVFVLHGVDMAGPCIEDELVADVEESGAAFGEFAKRGRPARGREAIEPVHDKVMDRHWSLSGRPLAPEGH